MTNASLAQDIPSVEIPGLIEDQAFRFDTELEFERPELNQLRDIWKQKVADRAICARADFDARTIKPFMRHLNILETVRQPDGSRRYRHRYQGSALVEVFGEQTNHYLDEFIPRDKLVRWHAGLDLAVLSGRPIRFVINFTSPQISYLKSECIAIPVSDDGQTVNMVLAFNYFGPKQT